MWHRQNSPPKNKQAEALRFCLPIFNYLLLRPLPRFPAATRDLALICDDELPVAALEKAIREAVGKVLEEVSLFDVYRGEQVAEGKKSVAYSLTMRADDRTLTDEEADAAIKRVLKSLANLGVEIRS